VDDGQSAMIDDVLVRPLRTVVDGRGKVLQMLRVDSPEFIRFGEIYFSVVNPGCIKAWKRHRRMTQNLAVPVGRLRVVIFDPRADSESFKALKIIESGEDDYALITIPPGLWYGFQALSLTPALIANCTDLPHDSSESETVDHSDMSIVPYAWNEPA